MFVQPFTTNPREMEININGVRIHARIFDDDRLEIVRVVTDDNSDPNNAHRYHVCLPKTLIEAACEWMCREEASIEADKNEAEDY